MRWGGVCAGAPWGEHEVVGKDCPAPGLLAAALVRWWVSPGGDGPRRRPVPAGVGLVACENTNPGNPKSEWDISGSGSSNPQGFATDISVNVGQTVRFKVSTPARSYRLEQSLGYYAGNGARKVATVALSASLPQNQPNCLPRPPPAWWTAVTGGCLRLGRFRLTRYRASTSPSSSAPTGRPAPATSSSSCGTTTAAGHPVPDFRHDLAGLQPVRRNSTHRVTSRPGVQGRLQPAVHDPWHQPGGLAVQL